MRLLFESGNSRQNKIVGSYYSEKEQDCVLIYILSDKFSTAAGDIYIAAQTDVAVEGQYLSDDKKAFQHIKVWVNDHSEDQFEYTRGVSGGHVSEEFFPKDIGDLPMLTEEEEKRAASCIRLVMEEDLAELENDRAEATESGTDMHDEFPESHVLDDQSEPETMRVGSATKYNYFVQHENGFSMFTTYQDAWDSACHALRVELAYKRYDSSMNPARQKAVLDALDAALLATELEITA